jgi:MFS family permease
MDSKSKSSSRSSLEATVAPNQRQEELGEKVSTENDLEQNQHEHENLPPVDQGLMAWLQVLAGALLMFNCWGIVLSFGTFEEYYTSGGISDQSSRSNIAWIGSIQAFMLMTVGSLFGKFIDAGHFRVFVAVGTFLIVFGMMMTSLATKYYQFILAQGLCVGAGMACFLIPSVAIPATWFHKRRGLALGIITTGSTVGGVIYPIVLFKTVPQVGLPWATRIFGFIALATLLIPNFVLRQRILPKKRKALIEYRALKEPVFALLFASLFTTFLGLLVFYHFIVLWAQESGINMHGLPTFYLLPILNAASCVGRLFPSHLTDYVGVLNVQIPGMFFSAIMVLLWIPAKSVASVLVVVVLYGFFSGVVAALPPVAVASLTEDFSTLGGRLGIVFGGMGISSLIGSPVSGAIVQLWGGNYNGARIYAGIVLLAGCAMLTVGRFIHTKGKLIVKV